MPPPPTQREVSRPFLKITVALPNMVTVARCVLEKGMAIPGLACGPLVLPTFESNVLFILRFMVDCKARNARNARTHARKHAYVHAWHARTDEAWRMLVR